MKEETRPKFNDYVYLIIEASTVCHQTGFLCSVHGESDLDTLGTLVGWIRTDVGMWVTCLYT